ncbi:MAG: exodeoxyribonuclease VII small subunit [Anaerolineae bacterium]|jgi:exodeoxyribonuclease VII small subunit
MSDELEALSFEQAVGELEGTVERLEEGDLSLTDAIALYERGMRLVQHCNDLLDAAELQVQTLAEPGSISET